HDVSPRLVDWQRHGPVTTCAAGKLRLIRGLIQPEQWHRDAIAGEVLLHQRRDRHGRRARWKFVLKPLQFAPDTLNVILLRSNVRNRLLRTCNALPEVFNSAQGRLFPLREGHDGTGTKVPARCQRERKGHQTADSQPCISRFHAQGSSLRMTVDGSIEPSVTIRTKSARGSFGSVPGTSSSCSKCVLTGRPLPLCFRLSSTDWRNRSAISRGTAPPAMPWTRTSQAPSSSA